MASLSAANLLQVRRAVTEHLLPLPQDGAFSAPELLLGGKPGQHLSRLLQPTSPQYEAGRFWSRSFFLDCIFMLRIQVLVALCVSDISGSAGPTCSGMLAMGHR